MASLFHQLSWYKTIFFPFRFPHWHNIKDFSETSPFAVIICGKACLRIGKIELNVWNREKFDQKHIEFFTTGKKDRDLTD